MRSQNLSNILLTGSNGYIFFFDNHDGSGMFSVHEKEDLNAFGLPSSSQPWNYT